MSEANKEALRRFYKEVFSKGHLDAVDELVAPNCVEHTPPPGFPDDVRAALKQFTQMLRQAFPDIHFRAEQLIAEGDMVAAFWKAEGTHQGEFMGLPATGQPISFEGLDLVRVVDGRATDHWGFDNSMLRIGGGGSTPPA